MPLWLAPEQYAILPVSDRFEDFAKQIQTELKAYDIRGVIDNRSESIGRKIRDTEVKKIPFMFIVGDKEAEANTLSVRKQGEGDIGTMTIAEFAAYFKEQAAIVE